MLGLPCYPDRLPVIAYYVSGHGYGHAIRSNEVARHLLRLLPDATILFRGGAPAWLFPPHPRIHVSTAQLDCGVAESPDALRIDAAATVAALRQFLTARRQIIREEAAFLQSQKANIVVADIPYLAGPAAHAAGLSSIGISNFTWNWIIEPFAESEPELTTRIRDGYSRMETLLRLPFFHHEGMEMFPEILDMPLLAGQPSRSRESVRHEFHAHGRPLVWIALRGNINAAAVQRAASSCPDTLFLTTDSSLDGLAGNLRLFRIADDLTVSDVVAACDAVVGKLGYSLVSECVAAKTRLVMIPRTGFREDPITETEASRFTVLEPMPYEDYLTGRWRSYLDAALSRPVPHASAPLGGASACARFIASRL